MSRRLSGQGLLHGHQDGARRDERNAQPVGERQFLAQEDRPKHRDQHHAELVDRRHARRVDSLEIAQPLGGCKAGLIVRPSVAGDEPGVSIVALPEGNA